MDYWGRTGQGRGGEVVWVWWVGKQMERVEREGQQGVGRDATRPQGQEATERRRKKRGYLAGPIWMR